jgi:periplasmic divalent cation tolerance protein
MTGYGMLLTTLPSKEAAADIARMLIDEKLAACVQLCAIESFYRWQGKIANEAETLLLIKTRTALFDATIARIKQVHPYTVPEIVGTGFIAGFQGYFDWIDQSTRKQEKIMSRKKPGAKKTAVKTPAAQKTKVPSHPHGDGQISARKSAGMRTGISRPMRVK